MAETPAKRQPGSLGDYALPSMTQRKRDDDSMRTRGERPVRRKQDDQVSIGISIQSRCGWSKTPHFGKLCVHLFYTRTHA